MNRVIRSRQPWRGKSASDIALGIPLVDAVSVGVVLLQLFRVLCRDFFSGLEFVLAAANLDRNAVGIFVNPDLLAVLVNFYVLDAVRDLD